MSKVIGPVLQIAGALTGNVWLTAIGTGMNIYSARSEQRKAEQRARDAYNASLTDRLEMIDLQPSAPRSLVLGRVRYVEGVRRRWTSGPNDEKLTLIVSFAGHEIDAFEQFWFDDVPLTLDANGWVLTEPFYKTEPRSARQVVGATSSTQTFTLDHPPTSGTVEATWTTGPSDNPEFGSATPNSISGASVTFSGLPTSLEGPVQVVITYQWAQGTSTARIRAYRGATGQNVGAELAAEYPGKISATDRFEGIALAVLDVLYDTDVYPQGRPNLTATLRGARLFDPRTSTTAWSENPALAARAYATWANGWALPSAEVYPGDIQAAADVCDQTVAFPVRTDGVLGTVSAPRYTCGLAIPSDADPRQAMNEILATMAGRDGWAGGLWRLRAGHMRAPSFTLDPSWLASRMQPDGTLDAEPVFRAVNGLDPDQQINRVTGSCVDQDQRWQLLPFPAVQDDTAVAAKGEKPVEVVLSGVHDIVHAQHLGRLMIRDNQAPLRMSARCHTAAWPCELFDVGVLALPRYGMTPEVNKTAEVIGWTWSPATGVQLQLAEISAAMFDVAELTGRDPAPNGVLPRPGDIETLSITDITSGTEALSDGSILTRTRVQWSPAVAAAVRVGGQIEVQYTPAGQAIPSGDWPSWIEAGSASEAIIPALQTGQWFIFRIRALKPSLGVKGPWSAQRAALVALPPGAGLQTEFSADAVSWHPTYTMGDKWRRERNSPTGVWSDAIRIAGVDASGYIDASPIVGSATITAASHTPDGQIWRDAIVSRSYTATMSGQVTVSVSGWLSLAYTSGATLGAEVRAGISIDGYWSGANDDFVAYVPPGAVGSGGEIRQSISSSRTFDVIAGQSYTFLWLAKSLDPGPTTATVANVQMTLAAPEELTDPTAIHVRTDLADPSSPSTGAGMVSFQQDAPGAIARTVRELLETEIRADDFATLQQALNAAAGMGGANVVLTPRATYTLTTQLSIPAGCGLVGDGSATLYAPAAAFPNTSVSTRYTSTSAVIDASGLAVPPYTAKSRIRLRGFKVASEVASGRVVDAIVARNVIGFTAEDLEITGFPAGCAFRLASITGDSAIRRCHIHECHVEGSFSALPQVTAVEVDNDPVNGIGTDGLVIDGNRITNLTVGPTVLAAWGYQTDAINVLYSARRVSIHGNVIKNVGEGIDLFSHETNVFGNHITDAYIFGVKMIHGAEGNAVHGNTIIRPGKAGIVVSGSTSPGVGDTSNHTISANIITDVNAAGNWAPEDTACILTSGSGWAYKVRDTLFAGNLLSPGGNTGYNIIRASDGTNVQFRDNTMPTSGALGLVRTAGYTEKGQCVDARRTLVSVHPASATVCIAGTATEIEFDTVDIDDRSEFNTTAHRWVCQIPGVYEVAATVRFPGMNVGSPVELLLRKNESAFASNQSHATGGTDLSFSVKKSVSCIPGDYVTVAVKQSDSVNRAITNNGIYTFLSIRNAL